MFSFLFLFANDIVMCALAAFHKRHPVNLILLGMFTLTMAFTMGLSCAFVKGNKNKCYNLILVVWIFIFSEKNY